jgi:hypothetical protein
MRSTARRLALGGLMALATLVASLTFSTSPASAESGPSLMPEPYLWCYQHPPFQLQTQELGWSVFFRTVEGTPGQNNYQCRYTVVIGTIPTGMTGLPGGVAADDANFGVGWPVTFRTPIDWANMCSTQYPGSHLEWIPGPVTGVLGAPWHCVGQPGVTYQLPHL